MHCDWLKKVTGHETMCQGLCETACKIGSPSKGPFLVS